MSSEFKDFSYDKMCHVVTRLPMLNPSDKLVLACISNYAHKNYEVTVQDVAEAVCVSVKTVRRSKEKLVRFGILVQKSRNTYNVVIPDVIDGTDVTALKKKFKTKKSGQIVHFERTDSGDESGQFVPKSGQIVHFDGNDTYIRDKEEKNITATSSRESNYVEIEEPNSPEDDVVRTPKTRSSAPRGKTRPGHLAPEHSGTEFATNPRGRRELAAPTKEVSAWRGKDLVAYWAHAYHQEHGEDDRDLFVATGKDLARLYVPVWKYTRTWLGGDPARAKAAMDTILKDAASLGYPVKLGYFFTPRQEGALPRLMSGESRTGKMVRLETPFERNDRLASSSKHNEAAEKFRQEMIENGEYDG